MVERRWTVDELLPHEGSAVLLDELLGWTDDGARASVLMRDDSAFAVPGRGVPAHVGIEYMAQTCGLLAGIEARRDGRPPRIGFLLGSREYASDRIWFEPGLRLEIVATAVLRGGSMAVFDCKIESNGEAVATARLMFHQPDDPQTAVTKLDGV